MPERAVMSMRGAMGYLQCSRRSIYNWIHEGKLVPVRTPGGGLRFYVDELIRPYSARYAPGGEREVEHEAETQG